MQEKHGLLLDTAKSPRAIEERSFAIIDALVPEPRPYSGRLWEIARRCIHTCGDCSILTDLRLSEEALNSGLCALRQGCTIYTDTRMAKEGLPSRRLSPLNCRVVSLMELAGLDTQAKAEGTTRAHAAMRTIKEQLEGAIVVIGNAPTALLCLLDCLRQGAKTPALIVGMPVGFVNAAQSKELLTKSIYPHFTLLGTRGGSPLAACCINAMAEMLLRHKPAGFIPNALN
ncbi:MAG: precorrin-8X methylmutase [Desulfovibrio sp.]|nr:precorrin-8X methylmutase [Desulfovibrio sp.]